MNTSWRHPGRTGAIVYGVVASVVGTAITVVSRLQMERQRGRRRVAEALRSATDEVMATLVSLVADVRREAAPDPIGVEPD